MYPVSDFLLLRRYSQAFVVMPELYLIKKLARNWSKRNMNTTNILRLWAGIAQSVQRLATGWTVRRSNPGGGGEIFRTSAYLPCCPPSLVYNGTGSISWG